MTAMAARPARMLVQLGAVLTLSACAVSTSGGGSGTAATGGPMMGGGMMGSSATRTSAPTTTCSVPSTLTGSLVTVTASDMGMMAPAAGTAPLGAVMSLSATPTSVPTGQVTLLLRNLGWRDHELVVLPLADGQQVGSRVPGTDGKVDEADSLGEASSDCASGAGEGVTSGSAGWVTLTLAPGRYELVCNLENHYADGMHVELDVTR